MQRVTIKYRNNINPPDQYSMEDGRLVNREHGVFFIPTLNNGKIYIPIDLISEIRVVEV